MRQYVLERWPDATGSFEAVGREYRYLAQVLRMAPGDTLEARLPDGGLRSMTVVSADRSARRMTLRLEDAGPGRSGDGLAVNGDPSRAVAGGDSMPALAAIPTGFPRIILFQWILKGPKMDQVIRQATETGVAVIVPVAGERCLSPDAGDVGASRTARWERIAREARQQSGSPVPTAVAAPIPASAVGEFWAAQAEGAGGVALVLTEAPLARKSLHEYLVTGTDLAALSVGPEGGMTSAELAHLESHGFLPVHFRTNVLRAETAALYGIAAVQSALTESEKWQLKE